MGNSLDLQDYLVHHVFGELLKICYLSLFASKIPSLKCLLTPKTFFALSGSGTILCYQGRDTIFDINYLILPLSVVVYLVGD